VTALGRRSLACPCDATDVIQLERLRSAVLGDFGSVQILVNCAGRTKRMPTMEFPESEWNAILEQISTEQLRRLQDRKRLRKIITDAFIRHCVALPAFVAAVPLRFVSRIAFHSDSGNSIVGMRLVRPAQFTRIEHSRNRQVRRSAAVRAVSRPSRHRTCQRTSAQCRHLLNCRTHQIFSAARWHHVSTCFGEAFGQCQPIPLVPPMTTAVLFFKSK